MGGAGGPTLLRVPGGLSAPGRAREAVLSHLDLPTDDRCAGDIALLVSELVTNAVRHAGVGPEGEILIRVLVLEGRLRLCVQDPGSSSIPRLAEPDPERPGGMGLFIVKQLSSSWGVAKTGAGTTNVWCEIPF